MPQSELELVVIQQFYLMISQQYNEVSEIRWKQFSYNDKNDFFINGKNLN
tara:strand:- start:1403 stop:1552 length:150 start_codon:yes stop_codon:yes gene_type:complete